VGKVERLVVGINGPSGAIYGIRLLEVLREVANIETHLVISNSNSAKQNIALETDHTVEYICGLPEVVKSSESL
jgi:flavin prenyltransferase